MSELPILPLWVNKYEGKTAHLSLEDDGAWIRRMMRVDEDAMTRTVLPILKEFFVLKQSYWISLRLLVEFERARDKKAERVAAGSKGGKAKALKSLGTEPSKATILPDPLLDVCYQQNASKTVAIPSPSHIQDLEEKEQAIACSKKKPNSTRGTRLPEDWSLPTEWAEEAYQYRTPNGEYLTQQEISHEADKFRDHWIAQSGSRGVKASWHATWRNWIRNGSGQIIRNRNATRPRGGGSGGQYERPSLAAAFMRAGGLLENENDLPDGSEDGRLNLEGRVYRGEIIPFEGGGRYSRG
jgi:uncharacterized protein YdaU (DUF1376 family)